MVAEGPCPPEEEVVPAAPTVIVRRVAVPTPAPIPDLTVLGALLELIRQVFSFLRAGPSVYIKAGRRSEIQQYTLTDTTKFTRITTIPEDALQWELWNSDLGSAMGVLDWAYVADPGSVGSGNFNRLALNDRAARAVAGVDLYVRPASANQVAILEVLRP